MSDIAKKAEDAVKTLLKDNWGNIKLTTSQIRKFLTAVNTVTNKVAVYKMQHIGEKNMSDELTSEVKYLKVKLAYQIGRETGRERPIKDFEEKAKMITEIDGIGNSIEKYEEFAKYVEALVAYHKYYGGREK